MIGILFKLITAMFPFVKDMLFGRSATGRTRMISFLIICNIAVSVSFFATAKVTSQLYVADHKHRMEIKQLQAALVSAGNEIKANKCNNDSMAELVSVYTNSIVELRKEISSLKEENQKLTVITSACVGPVRKP